MVARGLSEAKPLWRPEGGRESQLRNACQRRSLSGGQRERRREGRREVGKEGGRGRGRGRGEGGGEVGRGGGRVRGREGRRMPPGSLSHGEGLRMPKACRRAKASLEGGSDSRGKRVRGGERSKRDGHRCKYRHHRRNLKTSPEARGLP